MANEFIIKNGFISNGDGQVDNNLNVTGDVAGNSGDFQSMNVGDGGEGTRIMVTNGRITTSDATPTTIITIPTDEANMYTVTATIIGSQGVSETVGGQLIGVFENISGTVNIVGTQNKYITENHSGTPDFNLVASGSNILIQCTGVGSPFKWSATAEYIRVNNAA
jgi:hypothetical protein